MALMAIKCGMARVGRARQGLAWNGQARQGKGFKNMDEQEFKQLYVGWARQGKGNIFNSHG